MVKKGERIIILGALLKRIGNFDLSTFEGRLVLQKTVYLLQSFGLYLDYKFSWYIHGPYSPDLTKDAFNLQSVFSQIRPIKLQNPEIEKRLNNFIAFLGNKKSDGDWLEQLACTHFLKALNPKASKSMIIREVIDHEYHFTQNQCQRAWEYLEEAGLIEKAEKS